jgi:hypothetical protein
MSNNWTRSCTEADTVDHIIAGDGDDPSNLTAACTTCNAAKSVRPLPEATLQKARAEAWTIAAEVTRLAEQYLECVVTADQLMSASGRGVGRSPEA